MKRYVVVHRKQRFVLGGSEKLSWVEYEHGRFWNTVDRAWTAARNSGFLADQFWVAPLETPWQWHQKEKPKEPDHWFSRR